MLKGSGGNSGETFSIFTDSLIFYIGILFLGTLIWTCQILSLSKTKTTSKHYSGFLIILVTQYEHNKEKIKSK